MSRGTLPDQGLAWGDRKAVIPLQWRVGATRNKLEVVWDDRSPCSSGLRAVAGRKSKGREARFGIAHPRLAV